ncbi:hypothetical protein L2E82_00776 [Cichorium intybus]|uniref:Uncharacterized protein n=1 Tax=Cichorium intybus TaxID=13427 RepID=A0ACB9GYI9_CICIN|nr:hypothetical protein L2E82_00776 [Cichorium intybus]
MVVTTLEHPTRVNDLFLVYFRLGVIGEECIQEEELLYVLTKNTQLICYDGFEPSDRMHIAQVLSRLWVRSEQDEQTASEIFY